MVTRIAALFLIAALAACDETPQVTVEESIIRADNALSKGNPNAALIHIKNAIQADPKNPIARERLAKLSLAFGDFANAEVEISKALANGFDPVEGALLLAEALIGQQKGDAALAKLQTVADISVSQQQRAREIVLRGDVHLLNRDFGEARQAFLEAQELSPDLTAAGFGLARVSAYEGDLVEAEMALRQLTQAHPSFGPAWQLLGDFARFDGQPAQAADAYTNAIKNQYNNRIAFAGRAASLIALGEMDRARKDILRISANVNRDPLSAYLQGMIFVRENKPEEALELLQSANAAAPEMLSVTFLLGLTNYQLGQFEQAESLLSGVVSRAPNFVPGKTVLSVARLRLGDVSGAEQLAKEVVSRQPKNRIARQIVAMTALKAGKDHEASQMVDALLQDYQGSSPLYLELGFALIRQGQRETGRAALEKAKELAPADKLLADTLLIMDAIKAKEFDRAFDLINTMLAESPGQAAPHALLGTWYAEQGKLEEAQRSFRTAWDITPGALTVGRSLARIAIESDKPREAEEFYRAMIGRHPRHIASRLELAQLLAQTGEREAYRKELHDALDQDPGNPLLLVPLVDSYRRQGDVQSALALCDAHSTSRANDDALLELTGIVYRSASRWSDAESAFERLARRNPENAGARKALAAMQQVLGKYSEARSNLRTASRLDPDDPQISVSLAELDIAEGDFSEAEKWLAKVKNALGESPVVKELEAKYFLARGDFAMAARRYQVLAEMEPSAESVNLWAQSTWYAGDRSASLLIAENGVQQYPDDIPLRLFLAQSYAGVQRNEQSIAMYQRVLENEPNNLMALNNLAALYSATDLRKALAMARKAQELAPDSAAVLDTVGWLLHHSGDHQRAADALSRAFNKDRLPTTGYHLAVALSAAGLTDEALDVLRAIKDANFPGREKAQALFRDLEPE